jgi:hypothetical protein
VLTTKRKGTHPINVGYYIPISDLGVMIATKEASKKRENPRTEGRGEKWSDAIERVKQEEDESTHRQRR